MKKFILLATILVANISPSFAGMQAEPSPIERFADAVQAQPDPEILCRSAGPWNCLQIKKMQLFCRTEAIEGGDSAAALERLGVKEARQRYVEIAGKAGSLFFRARSTNEPRMIFAANKKTAWGCAFDGAPELIQAIVEGAGK